jgi:hypothetical protein
MNEQAYNDLRDAIKKALSKEDVCLSALDLDYDRDMLGDYLTEGRNLWQALNAMEDDRYNDEYKGKDRAERVEEEVVARCCESFLRDSKFVRQMAEQHYRSAREITRFLKQFAKDVSTVQIDAAVRAYEGGYDTNDISPENNMLRDYADIEKIADLWVKGLREIADKRAKAKKATGEIKASLKTTQHMTWDDQMKQYFSKDHGTLKSSDTLCVGKSGSKYSGFAMKDSLIGVPQSTVTKGMREKKGSRSAHELSKTNIINLGKGIMNPVAIVDNENRDCVYVVLDDSDPAGNPVIAVINKNRSIDYTNAHEVISAFGMKDFLSYIREHVPKGSRIEVFDKQKLSKRLLGNDVQFVELGTSLREFANVIIHDDSESVKRSEQTKASISDREYLSLARKYESGDKSAEEELRKAVDEAAKNAGYNINAFHGTSAKFTVFDQAHPRKAYPIGKSFGDGYYFAADKSHAENYAEGKDAAVLDVVLKMTNPYEVVTGTELSRADFEEMQKRLGYDGEINKKNVQSVLQKYGYDGIIARNYKGNPYTYVVYNSSQMKSSDAITYDDKGNIIPLSERFNEKEEDIRHSIMDKDFRMMKRGNVRTFEQNGTTANVIGSSVELEGGSLLNRVRMMQNLAEEYGSVRVDAASEKEAEAFKRAGAEQVEEGLEGRGAEYGTWEFKYQRQPGQDIYDPKQKVKFAKDIVKYKMLGIAA